MDKIGSAICINPGQSDEFHGVIVEIDDASNVKYIKHTIYGECELF